MSKLDKHLERVQVQELDPLLTGLAIVGATAGVINAINFTYRTYKEYMTKAGRACTDLTERERSICMLQYKIKGKQKQLQQLKHLVSKCAQNKKVQACKSRLAKEMQKIKAEIKRMQERVKAIHKDYRQKKTFTRKMTS